jgi:hypothetical protein
MEQSPREANRFVASQEIPRVFWTRRFITAFTSARHLSLSWANPIQSIPPHPTSWRSILILSSHLLLGLPSGLFPSGFSTKILYKPLSSPNRAISKIYIRDTKISMYNKSWGIKRSGTNQCAYCWFILIHQIMHGMNIKLKKINLSYFITLQSKVHSSSGRGMALRPLSSTPTRSIDDPRHWMDFLRITNSHNTLKSNKKSPLQAQGCTLLKGKSSTQNRESQ